MADDIGDEECSGTYTSLVPPLTSYCQDIVDQHSCSKCESPSAAFLCCNEECSVVLCNDCADKHEHGELIDVRKSVGHMRMFIANNGRSIKEQLGKTLSRHAELDFEKTLKLESTAAVKAEVNQWAKRLHDLINQEHQKLVTEIETTEQEYKEIMEETDKKLKDFEIKLKEMYQGFTDFQCDKLQVEDVWMLFSDLSDPEFPNTLRNIAGNTKAPRWDLRTIAFKKNEKVLKYLEMTPVLLGEVSKVTQICCNIPSDQFPSSMASIALIDDDKLVGVIDRANRGIKCFPHPSHVTLAGRETKMKMFTGDGEFKLQGPEAICHNPGQRSAMIVSDVRENCLIGFNTDGQGLWKLEVDDPKCLCISGKKLYVGSNRRVYVFNRSDQLKRSDIKKLRHSPISLAVARNGNVGTCDKEGKFHLLNHDFKELQTIEGEFDGGVLACRRVCVTKEGDRFLAYDENSKRIVEISANGQLLRTAAREGDPGMDVCPSEFTVTKKGHILGGCKQLVKNYPLSKLPSPSGVLRSIKN
ncbi:uncharacterized protein LOC135502257 [Lineus longissimus]|uniref:uncharacterized protein LOC135502257 n=1 Tax=Lineus longissimus TaxID=88925 RepID=UPI00315CBF33